MPRKIMTEADKKEYEKKMGLNRSPYAKYQSMHKIKKILFALLFFILIASAVSGIVWLRIKPVHMDNILGHGFTKVQWSEDIGITVEEISSWTIKKVYPGTLGDNAQIRCTFYDKNGKTAGYITFLGHDNLFLYEGSVYQYQ